MMFKRKNGNQSPFASFLIGLGLLAASVIMLWMNEGRINFAKIAQTSAAVTAPQDKTEGELISITGPIQSSESVGDDRFIRNGRYITLSRLSEMYAWNETSHTEEDEPTTYEYSAVWTAEPEESNNFNDTSYYNPPRAISNASFTVKSAQIGPFTIAPQNMELPKGDELLLSSKIAVSSPLAKEMTDAYFFMGEGTLTAPEIGDLRISFTALPQDIMVTAFGTQEGSNLTSYNYRDRATFYRALEGSREQAIATLQTEYKTALWGFRIFGTILMWIGFVLLFSPLTALLSWIPLLGQLGKMAIGALCFVSALIISTIIIIVSAIFHSFWAMLTILIITLGGLGFYFWQEKNKQKLA